jgi:serine phosphatase RsbU (regulator of sigma subunit)
VPGGRAGFVWGAIVGHDLRAAAAMGRLHAALQVFAARDGSRPSQVLHGLDEACLRIPGAEFATVGYGDYDPATCRLRYACAGHLPPLLVVDHEAEFLMGGRSTPLGVGEGRRPEATVVVPAGAMLLWYSDGLVERRHSDIDAGMDRLAAVSRSLDGTEPQEWCDALIQELVGGHDLHDDVVLICLNLQGPDSGSVLPLTRRLGVARAGRWDPAVRTAAAPRRGDLLADSPGG